MTQETTGVKFLVQFLSLFVPSMIAVGGSFWLYRNRQERKKESLRTAIRTEIESAERLSHIGSYMADSENIPYSKAVSTSLYENHSFELGFLDKKERKAVVNYYSNAILLNNMFETAKGFEINDGDLPLAELHYMRMQVDKVRGLRKSALIHLNSDEVPDDTDFD